MTGQFNIEKPLNSVERFEKSYEQSNNRSTEQREIYMTLHSKNMGSIKNTKIVQELVTLDVPGLGHIVNAVYYNLELKYENIRVMVWLGFESWSTSLNYSLGFITHGVSLG